MLEAFYFRRRKMSNAAAPSPANANVEGSGTVAELRVMLVNPVRGPGGFGAAVGVALAVGLTNSPQALFWPEAFAVANVEPAAVFQISSA